MPAEWEPHVATWVSWPHNSDTWPDNLAQAQAEFVQLVAAIARSEPVVVLCPENQRANWESQFDEFSTTLENRVHTIEIPTNDAWIRDYGPTFVFENDQTVAVDWTYNAWGGKYPPFDDDQQVVQRSLQKLPTTLTRGNTIERRISRLCLEGGAIEVNSDGTLLCTRLCVLNENRNKGWTIDQVEAEFRRLLGVREFLWMDGAGIEGDDTDGHIDQLARFAPGNKIVCASAVRTDSQHLPLQKNIGELERAIAEKNLPYHLVPLPVPKPVEYQGRRMPASYCNFFITNQHVLVPQFGDPSADALAMETLINLFAPDREVIGLPSIHLVTGLGSFHCLTQQHPKA